jgi:hypothetical protein
MDYIVTMVKAIEKYNRLAVISCHGRRFNSLPVASYYHNDAFCVRCLGSSDQDEFIHVPGTGVMAFHSSRVTLLPAYFKAKNMADIWFGILCQHQLIPVVAIAHNQNWIVESKKYDSSHGIYAITHEYDTYQTSVVNSIDWKLIPFKHEQSN